MRIFTLLVIGIFAFVAYGLYQVHYHLHGFPLRASESRERLHLSFQYLPAIDVDQTFTIERAEITGGRDPGEIFLLKIMPAVNYSEIKSSLLKFKRDDYNCKIKETPDIATLYRYHSWWTPTAAKDTEIISIGCGDPAGFGYVFYLSEKDRTVYFEAWTS